VLLSAIRKSPPSDGLVHDGKVIGKDQVTYVYNQVRLLPSLSKEASDLAHQPVPIPSYLIAIASGNVRYRAFPKVEDKEWTSGIWAEPELLEAAYWEFSEDTGRYETSQITRARDLMARQVPGCSGKSDRPLPFRGLRPTGTSVFRKFLHHES
jgi:hypothetical protein